MDPTQPLGWVDASLLLSCSPAWEACVSLESGLNKLRCNSGTGLVLKP